MWKKTAMLFGISALLLVGCNNDDDDLPENNETPMEDMNENQDVVPETNGEINDTNGTNGTTEDKNLDEDKDMMKDQNTEEEEIIEDDLDARDADNKDE